MRCLCDSETHLLKIEADYSTDPVWCGKCNCNLDIDEINLSNELKNDLINWIFDYNNLVDTCNEIKSEKCDIAIQQHNRKGLELSERANDELGDKYSVEFVPVKIKR